MYVSNNDKLNHINEFEGIITDIKGNLYEFNIYGIMVNNTDYNFIINVLNQSIDIYNSFHINTTYTFYQIYDIVYIETQIDELRSGSIAMLVLLICCFIILSLIITCILSSYYCWTYDFEKQIPIVWQNDNTNSFSPTTTLYERVRLQREENTRLEREKLQREENARLEREKLKHEQERIYRENLEKNYKEAIERLERLEEIVNENELKPSAPSLKDDDIPPSYDEAIGL
jgi:hypothetical protein